MINEILIKYTLKSPSYIDYNDIEDLTLKEFYSDSKKVKNNKAKNFFDYELIYPTIREGLNLL